jgi:hypothetical protein
MVFNTLVPYLEHCHGFMFGRLGDATKSDRLSTARGSYWLALPPAPATELLAAFERIDLSLADLVAFVTSERGPEHAAERKPRPHKPPWLRSRRGLFRYRRARSARSQVALARGLQ